MRIMTPLRRALTACTVIAGAAATGCRAQAHSFDGTYSVAFAGSTMTLTLRTLESGAVAGRIDGGGAVLELNGQVETDEEGDTSIEGTLTGPGGRSDFTLYREDDGTFGLVLTPYDAMGTPRMDQTSVYAVTQVSDDVPGELGPTRSSRERSLAGGSHTGQSAGATQEVLSAGATQAGQSAAAQPAGARDARIVGIWSTQVIMNSEVGSVATQLRMQFRADGMMRDLDSRTMGDVVGGILDTGTSGGGDEAGWRTEGDVILISYAGSPWVPFARFQVTDTQLLLTYLHDGSRQLWHRATGM